MIIRSAVSADAEGICAVWNPLIATTATTFTTALKSPEQIAADIAAREGAFFVAEIAGEIAGFATYFPFRSGPGYAFTKEHSINLSETARGHGAGRALMVKLEDHARAAQVHSLWAGISGENEAGVRFHECIGFEHAARLSEVGFKFGRWMDLVLMRKLL